MASFNAFRILLTVSVLIALLSGTAYCDNAPLASIGQKGGADGSFDCPKGVAIDSAGNIYVIDEQNYRVQKFSPDGTFIKKWGTIGKGNGQFTKLDGIAIDGQDHVYVTDGNRRVQVFDSDGKFLDAWEGWFQSPVGIAVDRDNNVFVADYGQSAILKFRSDGTFVKEWGGAGSGDGQLWGAWGVATDADGNVFVSEYWNYRISEFTNDGTFIRKWGSQGSGNGQFSHIEGIVTDASGNVYVADNANNNIQKFGPDGSFIRRWDNTMNGYGFRELAGIAMDRDGNLYVANYKGYNVIIIRGAELPAMTTIAATAKLLPTTNDRPSITATPLPTMVPDVTAPIIEQAVTPTPGPTASGYGIGQFLDSPFNADDYVYCCCPAAIAMFALAVIGYFLLFRRPEPEEPDSMLVYNKNEKNK